jgi:NADPH:quinone reductase-like Zn-dependent oxidoreductase
VSARSRCSSLRRATFTSSRRRRPDDEDFVKSLGAAENRRLQADLEATIRERHSDSVNGVLDLVNRDANVFRSMVELVRPGGHATSIVGGAGDAAQIGDVAVSNSGGDPKHLTTLADIVVAGTLRPQVRRTYELAEGTRALEDFLNQHTLGKLVVIMA